MATATIGTSSTTSEITECSICRETFKEPKALPCIHTFCLQCLDTYCTNRREDEMTCPLCRKGFILPNGGVISLPNNFFINQLLQVNQSAVTTAGQATVTVNLISCELCSNSEVQRTSTSYCIDCDQRMCDQCSVAHTKTKVCKSHQVIRNSNISSSTARIMPAGNYCDQHPSEQNRLYCYDCKMIMCPMCVSKHNLHKLSDVSESADEFREQIKDDTNKVAECATKKREEIKQLVTDKANFLIKVSSTEKKISQKYDEFISLIKSHKSQLLEELNEFKEKALKQIENKKDEMEGQFVIMESFKNYCFEMMNKGTPVNISRTAHDLHTRAEELMKTRGEPGSNKMSEVEITFKSSLATTNSVKNFIGELSFTDLAEDKMKDNNRSSGWSVQTFLKHRRLLRSLMPGHGYIYGLTILGSELFVLQYDHSEVQVYNANNYTLIGYIQIADSLGLRALVASPRYKHLYISDVERFVVYQYAISDDVIIEWSVDGLCYGLSVTNTHNVLASIRDNNQIKEYTPDGSLVRVISLDSSLVNLRHSVQLSSGRFVVCHGSGGPAHQVCIVDTSGRIIHSYGGSTGSSVGQLNEPNDLAIDACDNVLVADKNNNRVVLLSPSLTYLGNIIVPRHKLTKPSAILSRKRRICTKATRLRIRFSNRTRDDFLESFQRVERASLPLS